VHASSAGGLKFKSRAGHTLHTLLSVRYCFII